MKSRLVARTASSSLLTWREASQYLPLSAIWPGTLSLTTRIRMTATRTSTTSSSTCRNPSSRANRPTQLMPIMKPNLLGRPTWLPCWMRTASLLKDTTWILRPMLLTRHRPSRTALVCPSNPRLLTMAHSWAWSVWQAPACRPSNVSSSIWSFTATASSRKPRARMDTSSPWSTISGSHRGLRTRWTAPSVISSSGRSSNGSSSLCFSS